MKRSNLELKIAGLTDFLAPFRHKHWLVGVSGGADSVCLLTLLSEMGCKNLTAIYFEHHLRGAEGELDGESVAELCRDKKIDFRKLELQIATSGSIEENARKARLAQWHKLQKAFPNSIVLLAHNAGDRRENLILRLMRGGNSSSLTNLRKISQLDDLTIVRPLLDFDRREIESVLLSRQITWRTDITNYDNRYDRNYLRNVFFRRFAAKRFDNALEALQMDAEALELLAAEAVAPYLKQATIPVDLWLKMLPAIRHRALRIYLRHFAGEQFIPSAAFASEFGDLLAGKRRTLKVGSFWRWSRRGELLALTKVLKPQIPALPSSGVWESGCFDDFFCFEIIESWTPKKLDAEAAVFDYDKLPKELTLSLPEPGEVMKLYPDGRVEKLKKLRIDRKLPPGAPVLRLPDNEIIWYLGVRHSHFAPARPGAKAVIFHLATPTANEDTAIEILN